MCPWCNGWTYVVVDGPVVYVYPWMDGRVVVGWLVDGLGRGEVDAPVGVVDGPMV